MPCFFSLLCALAGLISVNTKFPPFSFLSPLRHLRFPSCATPIVHNTANLHTGICHLLCGSGHVGFILVGMICQRAWAWNDWHFATFHHYTLQSSIDLTITLPMPRSSSL